MFCVEADHWDSVITSYKEMELNHRNFPVNIQNITNKMYGTVRNMLQCINMPLLPLHVIALDKKGHIGKMFLFYSRTYQYRSPHYLSALSVR